MIAAGLAGGVVGSVPAYLKTRFGAHEVIVTIMLNFIVLALLNWFIAGHLHVPETLHTPEIHAGVLPRLADIDSRFHGSAPNLALIGAPLVAGARSVSPFPSLRRTCPPPAPAHAQTGP